MIETVWLRWFRLSLGATAPAVAATLLAFLAGQASGAALAARVLGRVRRPLAFYGAVELGAALFALAVPALLELCEGVWRGSYDELRQSPALLSVLRFVAALGATLPASLCVGATLPALGAAALADGRALGTGGAGLYGASLLGAALGALAAAFWLLEALGVDVTYAGAAALHAGLGVVALVWSLRRPRPPETRAAEPAEPGAAEPGAAEPGATHPAPPGAEPAEAGATHPAPLLLAALSGFGTFAAQVLLVQALAQVLDQSVRAFGAVLAVLLASLAAASALVAWAGRRLAADPRTLLGAGLALAALGLLAFPGLLFWVSDGLRYPQPPWPGALGLAALCAGPPLLAAGLVLPAVFAWAGGLQPAGAPGPALGRLLAANGAGAMLGALFAPFVLLPAAGLWPAFAGLALPYALAALWLPGPARSRTPRRVGLALGALLLLLAANPLALPLTRLEPGERVLHAESSAAGVVAVIEREGERLIRTDGHYNLGGSADRVHQERQGHLPLLLHPAPERAAFVGTATGITAGAAVAHPLREITLVEIVPGVVEAAAGFFAEANRSVHADPRARLVVDDARSFLRSTGERFDVVVADLFVPWRAGVGSLYTREHFQAVRERLAPGGLFCQWLPLYQLDEAQLGVLLAGFLEVFPRSALFRGDFFGRHPIAAVVGFRDGAPAAQQVSEAARRLGASGVADRWVTDPLGVWSLYVGALARLDMRLGSNREAHPRLEFMAARSHARGTLEPVTGLRWIRFAERATAAPADGALFPDLSEAARRSARGGARLQAAGALFAGGSHHAAARELAAASELLPRHLLAAAPADPSAAEVWGADPAPGRGP